MSLKRDPAPAPSLHQTCSDAASLSLVWPLPLLPLQVILVDHASDEGLALLEAKAAAAVAEAASQGPTARVRALANVVCDHFGGPYEQEDTLAQCAAAASGAARKARRSCVIPLTCLSVGGSRHRALLFKVLADSMQLGISCQLVKGSYLSLSDDKALAVVKLDGRDLLVDLVSAPGTLITPEYAHSPQWRRLEKQASADRRSKQAAGTAHANGSSAAHRQQQQQPQLGATGAAEWYRDQTRPSNDSQAAAAPSSSSSTPFGTSAAQASSSFAHATAAVLPAPPPHASSTAASP